MAKWEINLRLCMWVRGGGIRFGSGEEAGIIFVSGEGAGIIFGSGGGGEGSFFSFF